MPLSTSSWTFSGTDLVFSSLREPPLVTLSAVYSNNRFRPNSRTYTITYHFIPYGICDDSGSDSAVVCRSPPLILSFFSSFDYLQLESCVGKQIQTRHLSEIKLMQCLDSTCQHVDALPRSFAKSRRW